MGTGDFAVPPLKAIIEAGHDVVAVVSQPDRKRGRGLRAEPTPVKKFAESAGIPVWQPENIRGEPAREHFESFKSDIAVVAAYGKILPDWVFALPRFGAINIHGSLLPAYRGAAPIQRAVMNGEIETGVTIVKVAPEVDSGEIMMRKKTPLGPEETSGDMFQRLSALGAEAIVEALDVIEKGEAGWGAQQGPVTYAPKIDKAEGLIDWNAAATSIRDQIRALNPNPGAYFVLNGKRVKAWSSDVVPDICGKPGEIVEAGKAGLVVAAGRGGLRLSIVQPEGKQKMTGAGFVNGHRLAAGAVIK